MLLRFSWATSASTSLLLFFSIFPIIVFHIYFLNICTSPTFLPLPPYLFISPLPSKLISFFLFLFIFLYFCLFLFTPFIYKFVDISSILCIIFPHKKKKKKRKGSLSLSLSLSLKLLVDFLFFLHICFRLIIFYTL